jgi:hypothetical protein
VGLFFHINTDMTALTRNPVNQNFLQPNKFTLNFSRLPNTQFFCQSLSVPGISLSEVPQNTPFVDLYLPGEKAIYDLLNVTFFVDEELTAWREIHDWIRAMTFPVNFDEYKNLGRLNKMSGARESMKPQYSDASITLLSSSNKPYFRFKFYDCFPTTLSTFVMGASDSPETQITADGTFRYSYYDIEKLF